MKIEFIDITSYRGISSNAEHYYATRIAENEKTYQCFITDFKPYGKKEDILFFPNERQAADMAAKDNEMNGYKGTIVHAQIQQLVKEGTTRFPSITDIIRTCRKRFPGSILSITMYGNKNLFCKYLQSLQTNSPETLNEILSLLGDIKPQPGNQTPEQTDYKGSNTLYQPEGYTDDGTNIAYTGIPAGLNDNSYFSSKEDCIKWLRDNNYDPRDFVIHEYPEDDTDSPEIVEV